MRSNTNRILQILIASLFLVSPLLGQVESETDITDTIVVVKDLLLQIEEQEPYNLLQESNTETQSSQSNVQISNLEEVDIDYQDPPLSINPIRFTERLEKKGNDGLIKVGYGTPRAIDTKLLYTYHIEDWYQIGIKAGYSSANNESVNNMEYTDWHLGLMGGYWLTPNLKFSLDTDFNRRNQGMYGQSFGQKPILGNRIIQSIENKIGFNFSKYEEIGLQMDGVFAYDAAQVIDETDQQNEIYGEFHFAKTIWNGINLDITAGAQSLSAKDAESVASFSINPSLRYVQDQFSVEAGIHYLQHSGSPTLWPRVNAEYSLIDLPITFQLFSTLTSQAGSLLSITKENPFITLNNGELATGLTRDRKIGFNTKYTQSKFEVSPYFAYRIQNDTPIYIREDITYQVQFQDEIKSFTMGIKGSAFTNAMLNFDLDASYNLYPNPTYKTISYLPLFEVKLSANQKFISERLLLSQSFYFSERSIGSSVTNPTTGLEFDSKIINLSASANFKIFPNFWIYVEGDNLFVQDYQIWQGYDVFQPKVIFGIKYLIGQK